MPPPEVKIVQCMPCRYAVGNFSDSGGRGCPGEYPELQHPRRILARLVEKRAATYLEWQRLLSRGRRRSTEPVALLRYRVTPMTDKNEGALRMQPSGRWAICRPGHPPFEITSGDRFRIEVDGELKVTRMEFRHFTGTMKARELFGQAGEYYSADGYHLWDGVRAGIGAE